MTGSGAKKVPATLAVNARRATANKLNLLTVRPIGGRCGERAKEEQSREEETQARQEEGNSRSFAVRVK
jgi:hypothetical protein